MYYGMAHYSMSYGTCYGMTYDTLLLDAGSDKPLPYELPNQWLWDIIDEFLYQVLNRVLNSLSSCLFSSSSHLYSSEAS